MDAPLEVFQWATGWFWPVMAGLALLIAWGIARFLTWEVPSREGSGPSAARPDGEPCNCRCP